MSNEHKETYQNLYDNTGYASDESNSPGLKFLPKYEHHLRFPLIDVGCGRGLLVKHLREQNSRRKVHGIDFVDQHDESLLIGDITKPLDLKDKYRTAVCMDVMEHLEPGEEIQLISNLAQVDYQVISVHSGHSVVRPGGKELHINLKSWDEWEKLFSEKMVIEERIPVSEYQCIFLCSRKKRSYGKK